MTITFSAGLGVSTVTAPSVASQRLVQLGQGVVHGAAIAVAAHQRQRRGAIGCLAEQEVEVGGGAGRQVDVDLQGGTGIQTRGDGAGEADSFQGCGPGVVAVPAEELGAVAGETVQALAGGDESDARGEVLVPRIAREQGFGGARRTRG